MTNENLVSAEAEEHLLSSEHRAKIEVRDLTKLSDKVVRILNKVNVDIPRGIVMGVMGPSGSGKSTILRALNRMWEPAPGCVFLDGVDICDLDVLSLRRKVGMLFQLPVLFQGSQFLSDLTYIVVPVLLLHRCEILL